MRSDYVEAWHFVGDTLRDGRPIPRAQARMLTDEEIDGALDAAKVPELPVHYGSCDYLIARAAIRAFCRVNGIEVQE